MTKSKRKLLISMLVMMFVLLSAVAVVAIAFALTQQTITTTLNISYIAEDIDGSVYATYKIGSGEEKYLVPTAANGGALDSEHKNGNSLVFKATDTDKTSTGSLQFPEEDKNITLKSSDALIIKYTYTNNGDRHYIASMDFDTTKVTQTNMKIEYGILENGQVKYSSNRYALVVKGINGTTPGTNSYWIKIYVENKAKNASFSGQFSWFLDGLDESDANTPEYKSLTQLTFESTETTGAYKVSMASTGDYVGQLTFPSEISGNPVTEIVQNSTLTQDQKNQVTSVYIPDSIIEIGTYAFSDYKNLETVTFEQNETTSGTSVQSTSTGSLIIGAYSFWNCWNLQQITIPKNVTEIRSFAFDSCLELSNVTILDGLTTLDGNLFGGCAKLSNVVIPNSVKNIESTFENCSGLTSIIIPNTVTNINLYAFKNCTNLTSITFPDNSEIKYNEYIFQGCTGLESITVNSQGIKYKSVNNCLIDIQNKKLVLGCKNSIIPADEGLLSIGTSAFENCSGLTSVTIPNSVTSINYNAFSGCTGLTSVTIPNSVTSINNNAFFGCTGLTSITIPDSVIYFRGDAFSGCTNLTSVIFENSVGWENPAQPEKTTEEIQSIFSNPTSAANYLKAGQYGPFERTT